MTEAQDCKALLVQELAVHDRQIADIGLEIWLGAEPTFVDRLAADPQWQTQALGAEKELKAREFLASVVAHFPGSVVLRTLGRQYPGEQLPRWNYGIYARRDAAPIWTAATDPILLADANASNVALSMTVDVANTGGDFDSDVVITKLRDSLAAQLRAMGFACRSDLPDDAWGKRLLFSDDPSALRKDWRSHPQISRPPVQSQPVPETGVHDELASEGIFLVAIGPCESSITGDYGAIQIELPCFSCVDQWLRFLNILNQTIQQIGPLRIVITGFPPPVDETVSWTTVTPDPGVIEVNTAPSANLVDFYATQEVFHQAAHSIGLSPFKLQFNGDVVDSGGGQHLTFGGATPSASPFFARPQLLPRLVAYLNRHPALSYWFAVRSVGSCGQQPRADEVSPESLDGLAVAVDRLSRLENVTPEQIWQCLTHYLCDRYGNTHRCEINIEKLFNSSSPGRGCLGLVELRAFRMTPSPEHAAAIAAFLRTLIAWLATRSDAIELVHWGSILHDRFALPFYLLRDLDTVLSDLSEHGFPIGPEVAQRLKDDSLIQIGTGDLGSATLVVRQSFEFWPVIGDGSATERSFRMMDSSTERVEVSLQLPRASNSNHTRSQPQWRLSIGGYEVPWVVESTSNGQSVLLRGIRFKAFHPQTTVSPLVNVVDPLEFFIADPSGDRCWRIRLFNWQPERLAYDGMPADFEVASERRLERLVIEPVDEFPCTSAAPPGALSEHCIDLRRIDLRRID